MTLIRETLKIKPLSVNKAWQGRRFKTKLYKTWQQQVAAICRKEQAPKGKLLLKFKFGFSSKEADLDNVLKTTIDQLQKRKSFDDKMIYRIEVDKEIVPKGEEFIYYELTALE